MKKYDIFYTPLILELERIINSPETETFANALPENRLNSFIGFVEMIEGFIDELKNAIVTKALYPSFQPIYVEIDNFRQSFNDLTTLNGEKLLLQIKLREKIIDFLILIGDTVFDELDLDPTLFFCHELATKIDHIFFQNYNPIDSCNCGVFVSLDNLADLIQKLDTVQLIPDFWLKLLPAIDGANLELGHQYTLIKQSIAPAAPVDTDCIPDFLKLFIVSQGEVFHKVHEYPTSPQMLCAEKICIDTDYRQHNEIIYVLNEYNSRRELITKYLTIYQIIENFMYKSIIVELEQRAGGRIFSLRDFKLMYEKADKKEIDAIEKLCKAVFLENIQPGTVFRDYWKVRWNGLSANIPQPDINRILTSLGIADSYNTINGAGGNQFALHIARIIYKMRNSIVHNKATEFHLTNYSLTTHIKTFFERFLLPLLESMVFMLICDRNNHVWYQNREMKLY